MNSKWYIATFNHCPSQDMELVYPPDNSLVLFLYSHTLLSPLVPDLFSITMGFLGGGGRECHLNGISNLWRRAFFSLSIMLLRSIQVVVINSSLLCIAEKQSIFWMYQSLSICLLKDVWLLSWFRQLIIELLYTFAYRFLCECFHSSWIST